MRDDFPEAQFPRQWRICGVRIFPLQLGQAVALQRLGSPFAFWCGPSENLGLGDFALAIAVCSRPGGTMPPLGALARQVRWLGWKMRLLSWWRGAAWWMVEMIRFRDYLREAWTIPKTWSESESRKIVTPILQRVKLALVTKLGLTERDAMETPLQRAFSDVVAMGEIDGVVERYGPEDEDFIDWAKANAPKDSNG